MKVSFVLVCTCAIFFIKKAHGSAIGDPFYPLNPEDLNDGDIKELELLDKYYHRPKRTLGPPDPISASAGLLAHLKSAALAGTKYKIGAIVSGSAAAVGAASTGAKALAGNIAKNAGGAVLGSINHLKAALLAEATKKVVGAAKGVVTGVATGAAALAVKSLAGSANAVKGLKTAALTGVSSKIGQLASASAGASAGIGQASAAAIVSSKNAVKQIKSAAISKIGQTIGAIVSGSVKAATGASAGFGLASAGAAKQVKTFAIQGIVKKVASGAVKAAVGLATAGSQAFGKSAKGLKGVFVSSADLIYQLNSALLTGIAKSIGLIASGSAKAATGASLGIKTKVAQVSGNIAAGSADAVVQLKNAVIAGTKKKLGQAASGLAGAVTGAVGSASAGAGQLARGVFFESANLVNKLKTAVAVETKNKIGQVIAGSVGLAAAGAAGLANAGKGAIVGSASAVTQVKAAALAGVAKKVGQVASASVAASAGAAAKASSGITQVGVGAVKGTIDTANQIKSAAVTGVATKIGQVVSLSAGASAQLAKSAAIGSAKHAIGKRSVGSDGVELFIDLPKRSESAWSSGSGHGSADIFNQLKSAVIAGITKKIGQVAKGSAGAVAGASAGFSKGSFSGDGKGYHHSYEPSGHSYDHKPDVNVWELKKSVLNTLLQAVKAIKGGVLAIKGQLIKGSGYVVAGGGKLIAAGGDKVSSLGKNIISNAVLVHPHKEHVEYGHPSAGYTAPSGPPVVYDAPPSSGPGYQSHYESPYDHQHDKPPAHAGILLLKKIPSTKDTYHTSHSHPEETRVPVFKSLAPTGPGIGAIFGKFFTASTSLHPTQPTSFDDTAHGEAYTSHNEPHYPVAESHATLHPPAPSYYEEPRTKLEAAAPPSFQAPLINVPPSAINADLGGNAQPPPHFEAQFEDTHNFLNFNDYLGAEASNKHEQKIKLTKGEILDHLESSPTLASSQIELPKDAPKSFDDLKNAFKTPLPQKAPSYDFSTNSATSGKPLFKPSSTNYFGGVSHPKKEEEKPTFEDLPFDTSQEYGPTYSRFKKTASKSNFSQNLVVSATKDNSLESFLPKKEPKTPLDSKEVFDGLSSAEHYQKYLEHFPFHKVHPYPSSFTHSKSSKYKTPQKLRMQSDHRQRRPSTKGGYNVVKSVSYELTPDGAKRLT